MKIEELTIQLQRYILPLFLFVLLFLAAYGYFAVHRYGVTFEETEVWDEAYIPIQEDERKLIEEIFARTRHHVDIKDAGTSETIGITISFLLGFDSLELRYVKFSKVKILAEGSILAGVKNISKSLHEGAYRFHLVNPSFSREFPTNCFECIEIAGFEIDFRSLLKGSTVEFRVSKLDWDCEKTCWFPEMNRWIRMDGFTRSHIH